MPSANFEAPHPLPSGLSPDWRLDADVPCPECAYNLRMQREPRCPECGSTFRWQTILQIECPRCGQGLSQIDGDSCAACGLQLRWDELLGRVDAARVMQFEYAFRPFSATHRAVFSAMLPRRHWSRLPLEAPPAVRRLRSLRGLLLLVFVLGVTVHAAIDFVYVGGRSAPEFVLLHAVPLILPLWTALALPLFVPTLARFRILRTHLLRISAYGMSGLACWGFCIAVLALFTQSLYQIEQFMGWSWFQFHPYVDPTLAWEILWDGGILSRMSFSPSFVRAVGCFAGLAFALLCFVWWWRYLYVSLRDYLRLRPIDVWALLLSTQVTGFLVLLILIASISDRALMAIVLTFFGRI